MYITAQMVSEMEARFGVPRELSLQYEIGEDDLALVRSSRKNDRSHDITLFSTQFIPRFYRLSIVEPKSPASSIAIANRHTRGLESQTPQNDASLRLRSQDLVQ